MNRLEERYRRVLRVLPAGYRREWEEDMVAAFLDSMDTGDPEATAYAADFGRPSLSEVSSVVSLAVRLRLGGAGTSPHPRVLGQAVRLAVLMVMLVNAVLAMAGLAFALWASGRLGWLPAPPPDWPQTRPSSIWLGAWGLLGSAWLPAYVALVLGHRRVAQALALLAAVPPAVGAVIELITTDLPVPVSSWLLRLSDVLLVLALAVFPDGAAPVRRRPWLLAVPVGTLLVPVPLLVLQSTNADARLLDVAGLYCVVVTVAVLVYLARWVLPRMSRPLSWSLALLLLAAMVLALRLVTLPGYAAQQPEGSLTAVAVAQVVSILAVAGLLGVPTVRAWRRLPPEPAAPGSAHTATPAGPPG